MIHIYNYIYDCYHLFCQWNSMHNFFCAHNQPWGLTGRSTGRWFVHIRSFSSWYIIKGRLFALGTFCPPRMQTASHAHLTAQRNNIRGSWRRLNHTRTAFWREKKAILWNIEAICDTVNRKKILEIHIKRNTLILKKKISENKDYRASCCYIHRLKKKSFRTLHSPCPSRCSHLNSYCCHHLCCLHPRPSLFTRLSSLHHSSIWENRYLCSTGKS